MKQLRILVIILVLTSAGGIRAQGLQLLAGANYGGPIPLRVLDSSSGKPLLGFMGGISYTIAISDRFSFHPELYYSFRGVDYSVCYTKDTLVSIVINNVSGQVPSFYTAHVEGGMRLHYIDLPLLFSYRIRKSALLFGPYLSLLMGGTDAGTVRVVIGNGGFYDDYIEHYENIGGIRKLEPGVILGLHTPISKKISFEAKVSRSLFRLYKPESVSNRGNGDNRLYNTFAHFSLCYAL